MKWNSARLLGPPGETMPPEDKQLLYDAWEEVHGMKYDEISAAFVSQKIEMARLNKQIAALKEIAISELAARIAYENNMCLAECRAYAIYQARQQLEAVLSAEQFL